MRRLRSIGEKNDGHYLKMENAVDPLPRLWSYELTRVQTSSFSILENLDPIYTLVLLLSSV